LTTIAPAILQAYPELNDPQRAIVGHIDGPLLVIAGPGSGKTFSLVLRALNLLLLGQCKPRELVICTFTEKAAYELRDRIAVAAQKLGYHGDLSELRVSTIHGLCNRLLSEHRHRTPLGADYETLDDLTQLLFIFEHFGTIIGEDTGTGLLHRWKTRWTAIEGIRSYFNKIAEELIDPEALLHATDPFLARLGQAYKAYRAAKLEFNRVDFAHLQRFAYDLLDDPQIAPAVLRAVKYVLVDEYQDTNFIQEQLLFKLLGPSRNLCVVGDEDQSLYRFRGATVRNILEFETRMPGCAVVKLTINYRSHPRIVAAYDHWMASADWSNRRGAPFRYPKTITPASDDAPDYSAVFAIRGTNERDEAQRFADLVYFLKENDVIGDYSQVALLLHSVREEHSGPYLQALETRGIRAFCPRARTYFDNEEVRLMVACLALIFGWHGPGRGAVAGPIADLATYVDEGLVELGRSYANTPLADELRTLVGYIATLKEGESLDLRPADFFYHLLAREPFAGFVKNENQARNLAILSQLLNVFQRYYHYTVVTFKNQAYLRFHLFPSFLRLLFEGGINEYEDPDQPFPKGYVQVMTIHQAKGLEFPVVVVGSLDKQLSTGKRIDRDLGSFYRRSPFEPVNRITQFDRMRLHYVAFSRAEKVLVLTAHDQPQPHFDAIRNGLHQWPYVAQDVLAAQQFAIKQRIPPKKSYSFTGDLKLYETCPRQYQFFRVYDFTPSRSSVIFFGLLVHQTIEAIHRIAMDGEAHRLDEPTIRGLFDRTFRILSLADVRPIGGSAREAAFTQVMNYFSQNRLDLERVVETEVDVSVEKDGYILTGKVDLLLGGDGKLELLDFKTSPRPNDSSELLLSYERQLATYAHILERRHGKRPERLMLYWTAERRRSDALMTFPYRPELVEQAGHAFDAVVRNIQAKNFIMLTPPEAKICKECDLRMLCQAEGVITREGRS